MTPNIRGQFKWVKVDSLIDGEYLAYFKAILFFKKYQIDIMHFLLPLAN